jgi:hypothetical protein
MTGDADPTMMRPNTQRTPTTRAMAPAVLIRAPVVARVGADKGVTVAFADADWEGRGPVGSRRARVAVPVEKERSATVFRPRRCVVGWVTDQRGGAVHL